MAETSKIEWTDATVNFWWGCTKVGPGCDNCYAEDLNRFRGTGEWGPGAARRWIKGSTALIRKLNRQHEKFFAEHGRHRRVFIQSMSDLFDNEIGADWRAAAFAEIEAADSLDVQIVTKRVSNVEKMVPQSWRDGRWPRHVGLMITVCTQPEADRDVLRLLDLKGRFGIPWVGLSMEPLLEQVKLNPKWLAPGQLDWVIVGGEGGKHARPMHPDWARALRDQCAAAGVPFLFKQWGEWAPIDQSEAADEAGWQGRGNWMILDRTGDLDIPDYRWPHAGAGEVAVIQIGKKRAGRVLDFRTHDAWPEVAR